MRNRYDSKVAIPLDCRRRQQAPHSIAERFVVICAPFVVYVDSFLNRLVDKCLVLRCIRRLRKIDACLRGQIDDSQLRVYANELIAEYREKEPEDGCMALMDVETSLTLQLKDVEAGLETIRQEVSILDDLWKEGAAIRDRFSRILSYVEDMRQWADKGKLLVRWRNRKLLFQQNV